MIHLISIFVDRLLHRSSNGDLRTGDSSETDDSLTQLRSAIISRHWEEISQKDISAREVINFLQPLADLEGLSVSYPSSTEWQSLAGSEANESKVIGQISHPHLHRKATYREANYDKSICCIMEAVDLYLHCELDADYERADPNLARLFLQDRIRDELRANAVR